MERKRRGKRLFQELFISFGLAIAMVLAIFLLGEQALYLLTDSAFGTHGRLSIPTLGIDVAVYNAEGQNSQTIVDNLDSAAFIRWKGQNAIVDHRSQSFYLLPEAIPGTTTACLVTPFYTDYYVCTYSGIGKIIYGENHKCKFIDDQGEAVNLANQGGICMYTCKDEMINNEVPVYVTYWRLSSIDPLHFLERVLSI